MEGALGVRARSRPEARLDVPTWSARQVVTGGALAAAYLGGLLLFDPFDEHVIGCPLERLTGIDCPGCGSSRALWLVMHGDVVESFRYNPLIVPLLVVGAVVAVCRLAPRFTQRVPLLLRSPTAASPRLVWAVGALLVAFGVVRNLPGMELLRPPGS